jgi:hypothetical protein
MLRLILPPAPTFSPLHPTRTSNSTLHCPPPPHHLESQSVTDLLLSHQHLTQRPDPLRHPRITFLHQQHSFKIPPLLTSRGPQRHVGTEQEALPSCPHPPPRSGDTNPIHQPSPQPSHLPTGRDRHLLDLLTSVSLLILNGRFPFTGTSNPPYTCIL